MPTQTKAALFVVLALSRVKPVSSGIFHDSSLWVARHQESTADSAHTSPQHTHTHTDRQAVRQTYALALGPTPEPNTTTYQCDEARQDEHLQIPASGLESSLILTLRNAACNLAESGVINIQSKAKRTTGQQLTTNTDAR